MGGLDMGIGHVVRAEELHVHLGILVATDSSAKKRSV
jgi:hypothetical protein